MQPIAGKGGEAAGRRAHPRQHRIRLDCKHAGYRPNAQTFRHSGDRVHDVLGRYGLAVKERVVRFEEIGVTDYAVELLPSPTTRMAVGADITVPDPAIIGARFRGTVLGMGVD